MDSERNLPVSLSVSRYDHCRDRQALLRLIDIRGLNNRNNYIPNIGYVVKLRTGDPVSFVFLRTLEGNAMMFDSMITDPSFSPEIRDLANDLMTAACMQYIKDNKISMILAFSKDGNTIKRARSHGLTLLDEFQVAAASFAY